LDFLVAVPIGEVNRLRYCSDVAGAGVYLISAFDRVLYIGRSKRMAVRVSNQHDKVRRLKRCEAAVVAFYGVAEWDLKVVEDRLIDIYRPPLNKLGIRKKL